MSGLLRELLDACDDSGHLDEATGREIERRSQEHVPGVTVGELEDMDRFDAFEAGVTHAEERVPRIPHELAHAVAEALADAHDRLPVLRELAAVFRILPYGIRVRARHLPHPAQGRVVGYDADLRLPLIEWQTDMTVEACEPHEIEVIES